MIWFHPRPYPLRGPPLWSDFEKPLRPACCCSTFSSTVAGSNTPQGVRTRTERVSMPLSEIKLIRAPVGAEFEIIWLQCFDGAQRLLVSIRRADVDAFATQLLPRADQDNLVERNLETLAPIIAFKYQRGEVEQRPSAVGRPITQISLSRAD